MKIFLQSHWKLVLAINLFLGISLWLGFFTDISLRGTIPDILFPPLVVVFAVATIRVVPTERKKLSKLAYIPSYIGGFLFLLMACIMLIPPFTLGFLFGVSEIASEVRIQQIESPNNSRIAEVYFRPVGAYSGGSGRVYIRVTYTYFPFLERDIYYLRVSHADENTRNYLQWIDNDTLYISETDEKIVVGTIKPDMPTLAIVPLMIIQLINHQIEENHQIAPLLDIPIFPAKVLKDERDYDETLYKTAERTLFFGRSTNIEDALGWYEDVLSKYPWSVLEVKKYPDAADEQRTRYCIVAEKINGNEKRIFYWEFFYWTGLDESYLKIDITTPNPSMGACSYEE